VHISLILVTIYTVVSNWNANQTVYMIRGAKHHTAGLVASQAGLHLSVSSNIFLNGMNKPCI